jgi:dihydroorotase
VPSAASTVPLVVRGGTLVDENGERRADVLIENGRLRAVAAEIDAPSGGRVVDASGCIVSPGLVDIHSHLRQPGDEPAETVESGARAGALGGYTALVAMANTDPPIDSAAVVREVQALASGVCAEVAVCGAITLGRKGEQIAPLAEMSALGVRMFSDDGRGVQDAGVMRRALEYAGDLGVLLAEHCEDESLSAGGHMHEGAWSARLGIPAQPAAAESAMLGRDLELVRLTKAPMHFLHLSSAESLALLSAAKRDGLPVTAEATPHHLSLTDAATASYDARFKVNPPLRGDADVVALRAACADGTVDAISTDHAPHTDAAKEQPFDTAPPGVIGLETAYAVSFAALVSGADVEKPLSYQDLLALLCWRPARIAGLSASGQGGPLVAGGRAHLCVFDPSERWTVTAERLASRSKNSPYLASALVGRVRHTIYGGEPVVVDGVAQR